MFFERNEEESNHEMEEYEKNEKSTPIDGEVNPTVDGVPKQKRRGRNKCKEIAKLKRGEKLPIIFYNNRAVGANHEVFARHLGIIVRDTNIFPIRVHKWDDIGEKEKAHMWSAVTDVFSNENMEVYRKHVLEHMSELWKNWKEDLLRYNVKKKRRTLQQARSHVPRGLEKEDWEWLIKEIYSKDNFKKVSARNSKNRKGYKKELLHCTGSKPYRQVAWDLGAKDGKKPSLLDMFRETHKKGDDLATTDVVKKYAEIQDTMEKDPSLSHLQVAERFSNPSLETELLAMAGESSLRISEDHILVGLILKLNSTLLRKKTKLLPIVWRPCKLKISSL